LFGYTNYDRKRVGVIIPKWVLSPPKIVARPNIRIGDEDTESAYKNSQEKRRF
jgi:hypothetical protein